MLGALLVRLTSGPNLEGAYTGGELDCPPEPLYDDRPLLQLPTFCVSLFCCRQTILVGLFLTYFGTGSVYTVIVGNNFQQVRISVSLVHV